MAIINSGDLDKVINIERPVPDLSADGAGSGKWELVAEGVYAQVQDALPSRSERLADGVNVAARPARVRMYYRDDVTPACRFVMGPRIMQIVAGPAELGRRAGLEFMVEDYTSAGNAA
ncbi:head-tail adaptor protein [Sphingomonas sp. GC_Shp_3]|uniref:head-tail adaptor protein n=1 Tax=Sphingomonas sp. GC_Shp_3 TaxID=2937383 RepID=UPI00226A63A2|nr:head-tail adaptor protein [Sphingomonas sp. GC_Shp_3]